MTYPPAVNSANLREFGPYTFDLDGHLLSKDGDTLPLKRQSAAVLALLVETAGSVVTRATIRDTVWHDRTIEFDDGINACVRDIRRALGESSKKPTYIETIPKTGYRFKAAAVRPAKRQLLGQHRVFLGGVAFLLAGLLALWFQLSPPEPAPKERGRIAVMPVTVTGVSAAAREQAGVLTDQFVALLAERQTSLLVISVGELFAEEGNQPGMGDVSRWLSVDYLLAANIAGDSDGRTLTLRLIRTEGYVHLWSRTTAVEGNLISGVAEEMLLALFADARNIDGEPVFTRVSEN